jgi:hypothetical protein
MTKHLNGQQSAADRTNDGVHGIPNGIDPWNLISEKFQKVENACERDDPWVGENLQRLVLRREGDPVKVDCESGRENRQVKVDAS